MSMAPSPTSSLPAALRLGAVPLRVFFSGVEIEGGVVAPLGGFHRNRRDAQREVGQSTLLEAELYSVEFDPLTVRQEVVEV